MGYTQITTPMLAGKMIGTLPLSSPQDFQGAGLLKSTVIQIASFTEIKDELMSVCIYPFSNILPEGICAAYWKQTKKMLKIHN